LGIYLPVVEFRVWNGVPDRKKGVVDVDEGRVADVGEGGVAGVGEGGVAGVGEGRVADVGEGGVDEGDVVVILTMGAVS
jgi:hypothetical protein